MSDYMFLSCLSKDIHTSLSFTNHVSNVKGDTAEKKDFDVLVLALSTGRNVWTIVDRIKIAEESIIRLCSLDYEIGLGEILVVVPVEKDWIAPQILQTLPIPLRRSVDRTHCTSRGSLRFHYGSASSSYQSEYPTLMAKHKSGKLTSFRIPAIESNESIKHLICFINIRSNAEQKDPSRTYFVKDEAGKVLYSRELTYNHCTVFEIPKNLHRSNLTFTANGIVAIPLYISYISTPFEGITVEHSHPPAEYYWRQESERIGVDRIRRFWNGK